MSNSHIKFGLILSNGLGDSITDRRTEATISPCFFKKKHGDKSMKVKLAMCIRAININKGTRLASEV